MSKKVSMEDIARKLGISKNTVSLALRDMPGISDQTRKLIVTTAKELGYSYNKSNSKTNNICLILSKSTGNSVGFFNYIQFGMEAEAKKQNLNIIIYYYDESSKNFETPLCIKDGIVSGIITLGRISRQTIETIMTFNQPIVMVDNYFDNINIDYILTDNISGGYAAAEYLIKSGHKEIGFLGNISDSISFSDRYEGYKRALADYNIPLKKEYLFFMSMENLFAKNPSQAMTEIKSRNKLPEAIFCCNDSEAITASKIFFSAGIRVPDDLSLVGFDDIEFAKNMTPELTTIRVEKELMGKKAVEKLINIMENNPVTTEKLLLGTTLVERKSVKKNE